MKLGLNKFVIINLFCLLLFFISLIGVIDWAVASIVLMAGVGLSSALGLFLLSKKIVKGWIWQLVFTVGVLSFGFVVFSLAEYLNQIIYDGLITFAVIGYILSVTALLHYLSRIPSR